MTFLLFLKLSAAIVSVALAASLLARDHDLTANRLIAAFLGCNALWASAEFFAFQTTDAATALPIYRAMTLGWVPMGLLCMHASLSLTSMPKHPISRMIPVLYVGVGLVCLLAVGTDWIIADVVRHAGAFWRPVFGPGFAFAYGLLAVPILAVLICWRGLMRTPGRDGEDKLAAIVFFGVSISLGVATLTAVVLPLLGYQAVGLTTSLVSLVGLAVAVTLQNYGHALISPEAFAREIFDTLEDGVVVLGGDGIVRDANVAFRRMVDSDLAIVSGQPIREWIPGFPDGSEAFDVPTFMEICARNGQRLPVVVSPPVELGMRRRLGRHVFLIRDRREVVSLQRQLAVSGRLAAVGDLSKSIAESIHAPAAATQAHLERLAADWQAMLNWLEKSGRLDACHEGVVEGLELIGECVEGIDRVTAIVQEVGSFSAEFRRGGFVRHSLSDIVESAVRIARAQAKPHIDIETRLDPDIEILCHRSELERVVTNLIVNAIQALDGSGRPVAHLTVAVGAQDDRALLHVEDDGCGIPPDVFERIFDPFFTTKPVGTGTGLGLAISYHIVRKHGGQIRVSSIEGRGTSVAVELPRALVRGPRAEPDVLRSAATG